MSMKEQKYRRNGRKRGYMRHKKNRRKKSVAMQIK
jgi:hypothetical protein